MSPARLVAAALAVMALCHIAQARHLQAACPSCIKSAVVFGDSLSDTGLPFGIWSLNGKTVPLERLGYNNGRYTNKQVWVEILTKHHKINLTSFAIGGASINNVSGTTFMVSNQLSTFAKYTATHSLPKPGAAFIMAGSNDFLKLTPELAANVSVATAFLSNIPKGIATIAGALLQQGYSNIVISNLPAIGLSPSGKARPSFTSSINSAVAMVNDGISKAVTSLSASAPNAKVLLFDLNAMLTKAVNNPSKYGLTNVTTNCLVTNSSSSSNPYAQLISVCSTPDKYLFWDMLHPTFGGHKALAKEFAGLLRRNKLIK